MKKNPIYRIFLFATMPFLLYSCFVAKEYEAPDVVSNDAEYRMDSIREDTASMAEVSWKTMFQDEQLQEYIEYALQNNIDIRIAIQQISIAQSYLKQGKAGFYPTLSVGATAGHQELSANSQMGAFGNLSMNQFQLSANLSWEADIWGKIRSKKRAAKASFLASLAAQKAVKTRLIASVATTYYQLLAVDKQMVITKETIHNRKESVETIKALKTAGNLTAAAVKQAEAQYYSAQGILLDLQKQKKILENAFSVLLGDTPHTIEITTLAAQNIDTKLKTGVPTQLLSNRPDVIIAENHYRNAFEMTNVARSQFYPSLTITASGGFQSLQARDFLSIGSLFANLIGGLVQPIFNHRQVRTQYEVAQAQQKQVLLNFEGTIINASREVSNALYSYQTATRKIELGEKEYNAYSKAAEYSEALLQNGLANYLEVLTAQTRALNTQLGLINARLMQLTSIVELYRALGGGWQE